jgi:hypothetical protein
MKESEVPIKYYKKNTPVTTHVNYYLVDENDNLVGVKYENADCFSKITYNNIPVLAKKIIITHPFNKIPYDKKFIKKWIKEINLLGFPCILAAPNIKSPDGDNNKIIIELDKYKKKLHINVTLQLIRYLTESYICYYPDLYFQGIEAAEKLILKTGLKKLSLEERFAILQEIHKIVVSDEKEYRQANINHTITHSGNFVKPLPRADFFNRIDKLGRNVYDNYDYGYGVNALWNNSF